jgi:hypothetical protein
MLQLVPARSVFGLSGQFPPVPKSLGLAPLNAMLLITSGTAWVFLNVAVFGELDSLITWFPNDKVLGVNVV